jgi:hypothetical protein
MIEAPEVCIANFTVRYAPTKYLSRFTHKDSKYRNKAIEEHVKEFKMTNYPITLNSDNKFPTATTAARCLFSIWKLKAKATLKFSDYKVFIKDVEVLHRSKLNYKFNYDEH